MVEFSWLCPVYTVAKRKWFLVRNVLKANTYLEELYRNHGLSIPHVSADDHLVLPKSVNEAAQIAVQAEINNIAMYELFLKQDLPDDVRDVFSLLKNASENHLQAFQRQLSSATGRGRERA